MNQLQKHADFSHLVWALYASCMFRQINPTEKTAEKNTLWCKSINCQPWDWLNCWLKPPSSSVPLTFKLTHRFLASWNSLQNLLSDSTEGYMELIHSMSGKRVAIKTLCTPPTIWSSMFLDKYQLPYPNCEQWQLHQLPKQMFLQMVLSQKNLQMIKS